MTINYHLLMEIKYPSSEWSVTDNSYEGVHMVNKPPQVDLDAMWPEVELINVKQRRLAELSKAHKAAYDYVFSVYIGEERETWNIQRDEAKQWRSDALALVPFLEGYALGSGYDMEKIVSNIEAKRDAFKPFAGAVTGRAKFIRDQIKDAETPGDVNDVVISFDIGG